MFLRQFFPSPLRRVKEVQPLSRSLRQVLTLTHPLVISSAGVEVSKRPKPNKKSAAPERKKLSCLFCSALTFNPVDESRHSESDATTPKQSSKAQGKTKRKKDVLSLCLSLTFNPGCEELSEEEGSDVELNLTKRFKPSYPSDEEDIEEDDQLESEEPESAKITEKDNVRARSS